MITPMNIPMNRISAIIAAGALLGTPAFAQQTKTLTADKHNEYGLVYTLPVTALRVEVTAAHTRAKAGPYWQYAGKYIGSDRVVTADNEQWRILGVKVTPYGVADTETQYLMQLKPGALTSITVADDNMLLAINREAEAPALPAAGTILEKPAPDTEGYLEFVDEDFISSQSSAKRAQMLAASLMEVRDAKVSLSRGTADTMPTDGRQLELMLASLARQEEAFTAAFAGAEVTDTLTRSFTFIPGAEEGETILFRMSDFAGFVKPGDYSGDPVTITVSDISQGELPVNEKGETKKIPRDAVIYKIPGTAHVTISHRGRTLWSGDGEYGQYGVEFGLLPSLFSDRRGRSWAIFDSTTGALRQIGEVEDAR